MYILNLTQHRATADQADAGVFDLPTEEHKFVQALLTFEELPSADTIRERAARLACVARGDSIHTPSLREKPDAVMIGGAPYLMSRLEWELAYFGVKAVYAYSVRVSEETTQPDGTVVKVNGFKHAGFVSAVGE
jgi:hypothetical protein